MNSKPYPNPGVGIIEPMRTAQVEDQCRLLGEHIENQEKLINELQQKLSSVLQQNGPPSQPPANTTPKPVLVPLAERLNNLRANICANSDLLDSILRRLEL